MAKCVVFLQQSGEKITRSTASVIGVANNLKEKWGKDGVVGVVFGTHAKKAAEDALTYGVGEVWYSEHPALEKYDAQRYATAMEEVLQQVGADTFVAPASSTGKDLSPRIAVALDAGQASDIIGVNDDGTLRRPMYAGNVFADVELLTSSKVVTVRASAFSPVTASGGSGSVKEYTPSKPLESGVEVLSYDLSKAERPELSDAEVVVSGGRALQSSENFEKYIFPLADALGAAVGASRAAVDSGYAPNDWQVGQTGKVVAPKLYVAVGISGAIQHLAGMKDSKVIVAINKDPDAPIYEVADYGLVADLYTAIPELTEAIKKAKAQ